MPALPHPTVLVGTWRFERLIIDRYCPAELRAHGILTVAHESADRLVWNESGHLYRDGAGTPVWRRYLIVRHPDGWVVTFDDGRVFHPWKPDTEAVHTCVADTYRGSYDLEGLPTTWSVRWDVSGPSKHLRIETTFTATAQT